MHQQHHLARSEPARVFRTRRQHAVVLPDAPFGVDGEADVGAALHRGVEAADEVARVERAERRARAPASVVRHAYRAASSSRLNVLLD